VHETVAIVNCPCCGLREESEFRYRGDAGMERPQADAGEGAFVTYVYDRANPKGWHLEWWQHVGGCRQVLKVLRHTLDHEIAAVGLPGDSLAVPATGKPS
jgi:sarcosine oxidase subunit delta